MPRLRTLEEIMAMGVKVTIVNADGTTDQFIVKEETDGTARNFRGEEGTS